MYVIYLRNVKLAKKLNVRNCVNSTGKCTLYVQNVQSCRKIEYSKQWKFNGKLYILYGRNVWICRKIEYLELKEFNGKLCTLYVGNVWIRRKIKYPELRIFN